MKFALIALTALSLAACAAVAPTAPEKPDAGTLAALQLPANCGSEEYIRSMVTVTYGEGLVLTGLLARRRQVVEWYGDPDGNSWSLLLSDLRGSSCIIFGGERWTKDIDVELTP